MNWAPVAGDQAMTPPVNLCRQPPPASPQVSSPVGSPRTPFSSRAAPPGPPPGGAPQPASPRPPPPPGPPDRAGDRGGGGRGPPVHRPAGEPLEAAALPRPARGVAPGVPPRPRSGAAPPGLPQLAP